MKKLFFFLLMAFVAIMPMNMQAQIVDPGEKRPPEPYKGKGIKYDYEIIRRKVGKTGK